MGIKVLPPCVNSSDADFTPTGSDIRFGLTAVRNVGSNVVASVVGDPRGQGRVRRLRRLPAQGRGGRLQQAHHRGADQGRRVRLARPHAPRPDATSTRPPSTPCWTPSAPRRSGSSTCSAGSGRGGGRRSTMSSPCASPRVSGTRRCCCSSSARCSACTSPTTRCSGLEHILAGAADMTIAAVQAEAGDESRIVTLDRHPVLGQPAGDEGRRALGAGDARGSRRLDRGDVLPGDLRAGRADDRRGHRRRSQGPHRRSRGRGQADRERPRAAGHQRGPRGPVVVRMAPARCTPPMVDRLRDVLATHPGTTEVHLRLENGSARKVLRLGDSYRVTPSPALMGPRSAPGGGR